MRKPIVCNKERTSEREAVETGLKDDFCTTVTESLEEHWSKVSGHLEWLRENMPPYFFITMKEEINVIVNLASSDENV